MNIFDRMKALLADPVHWAKGVLARDTRGYVAAPSGRYACQWSLLGAAIKEGEQVNEYNDAIRRIERHPSVRGGSIGNYNDIPARTHAEILQLLTELSAEYEAEKLRSVVGPEAES